MRLLASFMAWLRGCFGRRADPDEGWVTLSNPVTRAVDASLALPVFDELPASREAAAELSPAPPVAESPAPTAAEPAPAPAAEQAEPASKPAGDGAERAA